MTEAEARIVRSVDPELLTQLAVRAARIPSSPPLGTEAALAESWAAELGSYGFEVDMQEVEPDRPNVVARLHGLGGGDSLLYNGHSDTAPPVDGWTKDPFGGEIENGRVYGQGMSNMKGSNVAMLAAVRALIESGVDLAGDVIVSLVVGECDGGTGTKHLVQTDLEADFFINGEPSDLQVITLHSGVCRLKLAVVGRSHHFGTPGKGVNAIEDMMRVLDTIGPSLEPLEWLRKPIDKPEYDGFPRLNVGVIRGGLTEEVHEWGPYNTPDYCSATVDVRHPPGLDPAGIAGRIAERVRETPESASVSIEVEPLWRYCMAPYEASPSDHVVRILAGAVEEVTGEAPQVGALQPTKFMGSDAGCLQAAGIRGAVCGVGRFTSSVADEHVELSKMVDLAKAYALATYRVVSKPRA
jgi:acetylornithine deacetylase